MGVGFTTHKQFGGDQLCGQVSSLRRNNELASFVKKVMAIRFLPDELISSIYSLLQIPTRIQTSDRPKFEFLSVFKSTGQLIVLQKSYHTN